MDLFGDPLIPKEITHPKYFEDAECLKQVDLNEDGHYYQAVLNQFNYCRGKYFYCKLAIWRDKQWTLFYSNSRNYSWDHTPFPGQLETAYRASKVRRLHYFDLDDGVPTEAIRRPT